MDAADASYYPQLVQHPLGVFGMFDGSVMPSEELLKRQ